MHSLKDAHAMAANSVFMREGNLMCTGADVRVKSPYGDSLKNPSAHLNVGEAQPGVQTEVGRAARHVQLCDHVRLTRPIVSKSENRLLQGLPSRRRGAAIHCCAASRFRSAASCCRAGRRCGASRCFRRRGAAHAGRHPAGGGLERRQLRVARVRQPHHRQAVPHLPGEGQRHPDTTTRHEYVAHSQHQSGET